MKNEKMSGRQLKKKMLQLLLAEDFIKGFEEIRQLPPRKAVGPLFSYLCSLDELVKWRAVTAMGKVISDLAALDLESARVVMRRFIWNLNDESGGIGWGCPESMAEAMACNEKLAAEYGCILISYIQPDRNYLEHEGLQRGVLWGVGRLAHARPECIQTAAGFLLPYMNSEDPNLRGLAVWAISPILSRKANQRLQQLTQDPGELTLYRNGKIARLTVGQLAGEALAKAYMRQATPAAQPDLRGYGDGVSDDEPRR
jgi:hypothetical protein